MERLARIARFLGAARGWRRRGLALALGAAAAGALPPLHVLPLAFAAFAGLLWLVQGVPRDAKRPLLSAFGIGWWFGVGFHIAGLHWIANALLIEWSRVGWMIPFAVFGLSGFLAIFVGLATLGVWRAGAAGLAGVFFLAVAWTLAEIARGVLFTGFPWNLIATVWTQTAPVLQLASVGGAYGLSALSVVLFALPAMLRWRPILAGAGALALAAGFGAWRLAENPTDFVPDVRLRLVQPVVPQALKWDPEAREANLERTIALSRVAGFETRTHVIWAETATAFSVWGDHPRAVERRRQIAQAAPPGGVLVTGAVRVDTDASGVLRAFNSAHALDSDAKMLANFDKFHLVPFGEYVPFRNILPIDRVVPGAVDFSPGPGPATIRIPGLPLVSPLICYEIIFPGRAVDSAMRPGLILNLTNDSWFGYSIGPFQHFASARFRAVEEGLPVVRAAGGGISGVIDPMGRVVARLELERIGVLDANLPVSVVDTPFSRLGSWILAAILTVLGVFGALAVKKSPGRVD
jgi:apolipoprotein N-acyltransferase